VFVDHIYSHLNKPLDPNAWPKTSCCPTIFKLSKEHENKWEAGHALQAIIFPLNRFLHQDMDSFVTSNLAWVKQKALSGDNWRLPKLSLYGFCHDNGKLVRRARKWV